MIENEERKAAVIEYCFTMSRMHLLFIKWVEGQYPDCPTRHTGFDDWADACGEAQDRARELGLVVGANMMLTTTKFILIQTRTNLLNNTVGCLGGGS